ncbi:hypothetical protein DFJ58DRAFT_736786 [Suillus subalutaceus]|uniref:uncharacterized protein n=1 Tax=Suillus subalutaceus TaxID=48586 RepID=UPI001B85C9D5|nr:uncharacterized protein DFJ58DRAFT_736786 [Suillus subalutaceus]KAG1830974.1 hypothetical protein DFJ58DRAFT_736786 [Suillus subalutaceus]
MAARNAIKLELPVEVKAFKFTFECRTPGPITVEISIGKPLQQLSSQAGIAEGRDTSDTHTETPGVLNNWLKDQKVEYQSFLLSAAKAGPPVVDDSVTEPESEPTVEELNRAARVLVSSTGQLVDAVDDSVTEPESDIQPPFESPEPATPVEFTRWYNMAHADVRPVPRGFSVPLHEPPPPLSPEFNDPLDDAILDSALTDEDLGIPTPGSPLPNLGPNVRSPV